MLLQLTARVSGLVGEPANETEKCFRLDSSILHGLPPSPPARIVGRFPLFKATYF